MKNSITIKSFTFFFFFLTLWLNTLTAQEQADSAQQGPSAAELAKANNPLADMKAFNVQNYFNPMYYGRDDMLANTTWFRFAAPTGRVLWRASLPLQTISTNEFTKSGLGDFDLFAAYLAVNKPNFTFGVGPSMAAPTATADLLGTGKWQVGAAVVAFAAPSPKFQIGGLLTWRTDFAGDANRDGVNVGVVQPFYFWQLGKGTYLRGAPLWVFNLENDSYNMPVALGIGKVFKVDKTVFNIFVEPQYTALHNGANQPALQIYTGVNMQFGK